MLNCYITERAVAGHDMELRVGVGVVTLTLCPSRKPVGRKCIGNHMQCRPKRPVALGIIDAHLTGHLPTKFQTDLFGHLGSVLGIKPRQRLAQQRDQNVVMADFKFEMKARLSCGEDLGRPPSPRRRTLRNIEIPAAGQLVQVMASHVGMHSGMLGHLRSGKPIRMLMQQKIDVPTRGVAKG